MTADAQWRWVEARVLDIRRGDRGTAVHKPLLLLLALSKQGRWHRFVELEADLSELLARFGGVRYPNPDLPFWHLQNDDGLWQLRLSDPDDLIYLSGKHRPTVGSLRRSAMTGGLGAGVWSLVDGSPDARRRLAGFIARTYFDEDHASSLLHWLCLGSN